MSANFNLKLKSFDKEGNPIEIKDGAIEKDVFDALFSSATVADFKNELTEDVYSKEIGKVKFVFVKTENDNYVACVQQLDGDGHGQLVKSFTNPNKIMKDSAGEVLMYQISFADSKETLSIKEKALKSAKLLNATSTDRNSPIKKFVATMKSSTVPFRPVRGPKSENPKGKPTVIWDADFNEHNIYDDPDGKFSIYRVEMLNPNPLKRISNKDTKFGYVVCSNHPTKSGEKSLYYVDSLTYKDGEETKPIDFSVAQKAGELNGILDKGGVVIHRVRTDVKNRFTFKCYNENSKLSFFKKQGVDKLDGLKSWAETHEKRFIDNHKIQRIKPSILARKVLVLCTAAVVAAVGVLVLSSAYTGADKKDAAMDAGRSQIVQSIDQLGGQTLFQYDEAGMPIRVGGLHKLIQSEIKTYKQKNWGWAKDYTNETIEGAAQQVAQQVVEELLAKSKETGAFKIANYNVATEKFEAIIIYATNPQWNPDQLYNRDAMIDYLVEIGYSKDEANLFVETYEETYTKVVVDEMSKDHEIGGDVIDPGIQPEEPVLDLNSADIKSAISSAISSLTPNGGSISADKLNLCYVDYTFDEENNQQVIFANAGNYIYKIDLTNGGQNQSKILSNDELIERIMTSKNVVEGIKADAFFKSLKVDASLKAFADSYKHAGKVSAAEFYITDLTLVQDGDRLTLKPTLIAVRDNGESVEEIGLNSVSVSPEADSSIKDMAALSTLGNFGVFDKNGNYLVNQDGEINGKIYDSNDLEIAEIAKIDNSIEVERIL